MVRGLASLGVHPNILTAIGVMINVGCGVLFGMGHFGWAGLVLVVANLFDMLDGNVARLTGNVTKFGGFLDSSLDRLSDMVVFLGIMVFYASDIPEHSLLNVVLAGVGWIGSIMVSYTTARSEAVGIKANVGFLQRPERIVLFILGSLPDLVFPASWGIGGRMPQVLWVLAIGSLWTFIHRMYHTWRELQSVESTESI